MVDDEPAITRMLTLVLEKNLPVTVVSYSGGNSAWAAMEKDGVRPDLLVTDLRMADGDGLELCRRIRNASLTMPIFILSAYVNEETALDISSLKDVRLLGKPMPASQLIAAVREAMGLPLPAKS